MTLEVPAGGKRARINRVVVIEDDRDAAELVAEALETAGYEAVIATSGADGLAFLQRATGPCVVLLDLHMFDMDGWEVLTMLREPPLSQHRVVIMSGADPSKLPPGLPRLRKPFGNDALLEAVAG